MIELENISLRYGPKVIFDEVGAVVGARDRIGLVGSNGAGKTTFLKALLGMTEVDGGRIEMAKFVTLGYLPQDGVSTSGLPLLQEVEEAFESVIALRKRLDEANQKLETLSPEDEAYHELLELMGGWEHELEMHEAHKVKSRVESVLLGLGFQMTDMERSTNEFSGGWKMRIALARLLLKQPSLLLLDEPTNHLDIESLQWLENYLKSYEGALLIVSHDRAFLDALCNKVFALSMGRLDVYTGNYSYFEKESSVRLELLGKAHANQKRKIEKTERFIERFRYKSTKAKQVQSRIKALDKVERIELEDTEKQIDFSFLPPPRSGQKVLEVEGVHKSYDDLKVLSGIDFTLERGDRVAVVGVNGAGKSTLARVIAGEEPYQSGQVVLGHKVVPAYFAQHQADILDEDDSALSVVERASPSGEVNRARSILGSFLFEGDDVFKKVGVLSGGERNRLALAKILLARSNFLILDEPTNHLDMRSKDRLQAALIDYSGTLLIVSHDRDFLEPLVTKVLEVSHNSIRWYYGSLSHYLAKKEEESLAVQASAQSKTVSSATGMSSKERRQCNARMREQLKPLKQKLETCEKRIARNEAKVLAWEEKMKDPEFFKKGEETQTAMTDYESTKRKVDRLYEEWEEVTQALATLEEELNQ
ncbi:MAG: ABC-F family ATP-binding cassette domain-containing protein [Verrucomicrobia bacterium]|nr:ABC-F family ATP-binding cassette domain-containing protein [Verrucomicrobiota bacterium]